MGFVTDQKPDMRLLTAIGARANHIREWNAAGKVFTRETYAFRTAGWLSSGLRDLFDSPDTTTAARKRHSRAMAVLERSGLIERSECGRWSTLR